MVYSTSQWTVAEQNNMNNDKPLFIANGVGRRFNTPPEWRLGTAATALGWTSNGGVDQSELLREGELAVDGLGLEFTRPTVTASTQQYALVMDLVEINNAYGDIDCVGILGHNFDTLVTQAGIASLTVRFIVADVNTFAASPNTLATFVFDGTGGNQRAIDITLTSTFPSRERWRNVRWLKVTITANGGGNFSTFAPRIHEVIMGRRCQLSQKAFRPYDPRQAKSMFKDWVSKSGTRVRYIDYTKQTVLGLQQQIENADRLVMEDVYEHSRGFSESLVYIEDPGTLPNEFMLMWPEDGRFFMPYLEPAESENSLTLIEERPFRRKEIEDTLI